MEAVRVETTKKRFLFVFSNEPFLSLPKEGGRLCIGIVDDIVVNNTSKCTTRSGWRGGVLGTRNGLEETINEANNLSWEGNWAALLALSVELLLIEESERRLVGRRTRLGGDSRLGLTQLGLNREELVLEGGTRGRRALRYGRTTWARGDHNW